MICLKLLDSAWLKAKRLKEFLSFQLIKSNYEFISGRQGRHVPGQYLQSSLHRSQDQARHCPRHDLCEKLIINY